MLGYKKEYGYFLRKLTPPGDPEFLFDGIIAENELVTNVVALTTHNIGEELNGVLSDQILETDVVALTTYNESESFNGVVATLSVATLVE